MIFLFYIIAGIVISALFFVAYKLQTRKEKGIRQNSILLYVPMIIGTINMLISIYLIIMIVFVHSNFQISFSNETADFFYNIFESYCYLFASPVSLGALTLTVLLRKNQYFTGKMFWYSLITNIISVVALSI